MSASERIGRLFIELSGEKRIVEEPLKSYSSFAGLIGFLWTVRVPDGIAGCIKVEEGNNRCSCEFEVTVC